MADEIKKTEGEISASEQRKHFKMENAPVEVEKRETSPAEDKLVAEELKRELDLLATGQGTNVDVDKIRGKMEFLGEKEKIEHLLYLARKKGIIYAVDLAKKMNEPYLLDVLHDTLAREGYYQKIMQGTDDDNNQGAQNNNSTKK